MQFTVMQPKAMWISIHALREEGDVTTHRRLPATGYFYPRPPRGGRLWKYGPYRGRRNISIHALREEGDRRTNDFLHHIPISIHALREEGDRPPEALHGLAIQFLSTPSARRATAKRYLTDALADISIHALREEGDQHELRMWYALPDFYPRPPRGGRLYNDYAELFPRGISIHALREEGDPTLIVQTFPRQYFYPRPPRGGRPKFFYRVNHAKLLFLSTPSARRATLRKGTSTCPV